MLSGAVENELHINWNFIKNNRIKPCVLGSTHLRDVVPGTIKNTEKAQK